MIQSIVKNLKKTKFTEKSLSYCQDCPVIIEPKVFYNSQTMYNSSYFSYLCYCGQSIKNNDFSFRLWKTWNIYVINLFISYFGLVWMAMGGSRYQQDKF